MKKIMLMLAALAAFAAVAAPMASATWTHSGKALAADAVVTFEGTAQFTGTIGTVHCEKAFAKVTLTAAAPSNVADVNEFTATNPTTECKVSGTPAALCGGE